MSAISLKRKAHCRRWIYGSDQQRAQWRGPGLRRLIDLWEMIREATDWFSVADLAPTVTSQARWVRRQFHYLTAAGLLENELRGGVYRFRVVRKSPYEKARRSL